MPQIRHLCRDSGDGRGPLRPPRAAVADHRQILWAGGVTGVPAFLHWDHCSLEVSTCMCRITLMFVKSHVLLLLVERGPW